MNPKNASIWKIKSKNFNQSELKIANVTKILRRHTIVLENPIEFTILFSLIDCSIADFIM